MRTVCGIMMFLAAGTALVQPSFTFARQQPPRPAAPNLLHLYDSINGSVVRETPRFQIYSEGTRLPVDLDSLSRKIDEIYDYLVERLDVRPTERFALTIRPPDPSPCPARGQTRFNLPVTEVIVFADAKTTPNQFAGVLAHEIAHFFHKRGMKLEATDPFLSEGFASWAAGKYWEGWQGRPVDMVRSAQRDGLYIPLEQYYQTDFSLYDPNCLRSRNIQYNSFAAFIDSLIAEQGMEKFRRLLESTIKVPIERPAVAPPPPINTNLQSLASLLPRERPMADFKRVYGLSLGELERSWLKTLDPQASR